MDAFINKIQEATCRPNITFEGVFLVLQLLWWGIDGCALVERKIIDFGNLSRANTSGATEVSNLDDHSFPNEYVFRFEITMEDPFGTHHDEGLDDLFENP